MNTALLVDASAWGRLMHPHLPKARSEELAEELRRGKIVSSMPFVLEVGYSARDRLDYEEQRAELLALPQARIDDLVEGRALDAQRQLARIGHHRVPAVDLIIATLADRHGYGVLHYDSDYDTILAKTDLEFESTWLAERGTL
jgi:predicted nucleic acid-binding protein